MAGRICKHDECTRPVAARGMCKNHYVKWKRKNPDISVMAMSEEAVLDSMPGTQAQLIVRSGLCSPTVKRALAVLNIAGPERQAHIYDYLPPASKGKRWYPMYKIGKAPNVRLTKERKREHTLKLNRESYRRREGSAPPVVVPASWADSLGVAP